MSLKSELEERLKDLNISKIHIDRESSVHGVPAVHVAFVMTNPVGLSTGELNFEIWFHKNMGLGAADMADLAKNYAVNQAKAFLEEEA